MKEMIVRTWCDRHVARDDKQIQAEQSVTITLNRVPPRRLDLCEECRHELLDELDSLLDEYGQPDDDAPAAPVARRRSSKHAPGPIECPICDETFGYNTGLVGHIWNKHIGRPLPDAPLQCPDCDFVPGGDSLRARATGVGTHRRVAHGYSPVEFAAAVYRREKAGR